MSDQKYVDVFVARQPVLDADLKIYGHELLYRSSAANLYTGTDHTLSSLEVIHNSLFSPDIASATPGRKVFINFTRELLLSEAAHVLDPHHVIIEVLENTVIDREVLDACQKLRERGYVLAADDIARVDQMAPLLELVDVIKVDFRAASGDACKEIIATYGKRHTCLAEKLETQAEFEAARTMGYRLFQGFFFARPAVLKGQQIPGYKMNYLRILSAVHRPEIEFGELERLIRQEVSVAYKLLRYANSALFAQRTCIDSIRRALVILGEQEVRKWTSIVLLMHLASDKPDALVMCALVRAVFSEVLAQLSGLGGRKSELFLMGMFSLLDAMTDSPLELALREIRLSPDIQGTLLGKPTDCPQLAAIYHLVKAYEQGNWAAVIEGAQRLRIEEDEIAGAYLKAVTWCDEVFSLIPQFGAGQAASAEPARRPSPASTGSAIPVRRSNLAAPSPRSARRAFPES